MNISLSVVLASLLAVSAQQPGHMEREEQPTVLLTECITLGQCTHKNLKVTLDANWRWLHHSTGNDNCYTGNQWDSGYCSDPVQCARECVLEGVTAEKYRSTYGIEQIQNGVKLNFVTDHQFGTNVGSRLYMLDESGEQYKMFHLKNREFAFTFEVSAAMCGMNGAMYFVEMDRDGGKGLGDNRAGAKYGTGYCDAQCPHDIKFISGEANSVGWVPNPKDQNGNMGSGKYGSCCAEMDIWEANSMANAYTPHPCDITGQLKCEGIECGDNDRGERYRGVCDKDGCDINPYRMGNKMFFGRGADYQVDTLKPITVVTQFLTDDGTDDGELSEMVRFYVQDGNVIESPSSTILGPDDTDSITDGFCQAQKRLFGDVNDYANKGGSAAMGESLDRGHVMAMSIWDDVEVNMLWLDSAWPLNKPATDPGVQRGDCPGGVGSTPTYLRQNHPDGWVSFQNAFVGPIGSFMKPAPPPSPPPPPPPTPAPRPKPTAAPSPVPTQSPTPRPQPTAAPSPVPTQCIMEKATVPEGCKEGPVDGWAGLGLGLTEEECQLACIEEDACVLAVYKSQEKSCAYFRECSKFKNQAGFVMWQKKCEDGDAEFFQER